MSDALKLSLALTAALAAGVVFGLSTRSPDRIAFLSVGQGDCAVIQSQGRTVLIDAGPITDKFDAGERLVVPKLKELGASGVDLILLSHPDLDHIGGTGAVLRHFHGVRIAVSSEFRHNAHLLSRLRQWDVSPDSVEWLPRHLAGTIGAFRVEVDCPPLRGAEDNAGSMFVRVREADASAVFSGDAQAEVERQELGRGKWQAQVLHVGHHGSESSSCNAWLKAVHPEAAVISCGIGNRYGHPHRQTLDRLKALGIQIDRTDQEGDIRFVVRNGRFEREP